MAFPDIREKKLTEFADTGVLTLTVLGVPVQMRSSGKSKVEVKGPDVARERSAFHHAFST